MFARDSAALAPVPRTGAHDVQFYEHDDFIVDEMAEFLDGTLRAGEAAVLIEDIPSGFAPDR
jgi:hypothetical protein